jgi:hypothetical protein
LEDCKWENYSPENQNPWCLLSGPLLQHLWVLEAVWWGRFPSALYCLSSFAWSFLTLSLLVVSVVKFKMFHNYVLCNRLWLII